MLTYLMNSAHLAVSFGNAHHLKLITRVIGAKKKHSFKTPLELVVAPELLG